MAWSYTVDVQDSKREGMFVGPFALKTGTWDGDTDAKGDILTGLAKVIAFGVNNGEVHTECPKTAPNVASSDFSTESLGTIAVDSATADNFGTWWAIGPEVTQESSDAYTLK